MSQNNNASTGFTHEKVETNNFLMIVLIVLVVAVGGLVEIVPLFFQKSTTEAVKGVEPYAPLQLMGRDIYLREGCYNCHSQMIRPFRAETLRYGHYSTAGKYSDEWHRIHLNNPRDVVPESNMPAYSWLEKSTLDPSDVTPRMKALRMVGVPYTDAQIAAAPDEIKGKTEMDALVAYLQGMGRALK